MSKIQISIRLGFGMLGIWVLSSSVFIIYNETYWILKIIADSAVILSAYFLTTSVSLIFYDKVSLKRSIFFSTLFSGQLVFNLLYMKVSENDYLHWLSDKFILIIPLVLFFLIVIDYSNVGNSNSERQLKNLELITFKNSTFILIIVFPLLLLKIYFVELPFLLIYFVTIFFVLSHNLWMLMKVDRVRFFNINNHFMVLIHTDQGGLIYSKEFAKTQQSTYSSLLSNWLTALSTIISEFFDSQVKPLDLLIENNLRIYFHWGNNHFIAVIADSVSPLIRLAMEQLSNDVDIISEKKKFDLEEQERLNQCVSKSFHFILPPE
ncbi:MAG: hypothetical protein INQ03_02550 [Candidatus Heimdallarchaeota archaeon]|nr:hypothetical protein [Candidatus Heimdallarchaeota archaeon]